MHRVLVAYVGAAILCAASAVDGRQDRPSLPYESAGVCPFECCTYRTWVVERDTRVLEARRDGSAVAFVARRGERVEGLTGIVVTTTLGRAIVRHPADIGLKGVRIQPGETISILHYLGEGEWKVWVRGTVDEAYLSGPRETCTSEGKRIRCDVQIEREPVTVWWAKIRNRAGQEGWTRQLDRFGNKDACG